MFSDILISIFESILNYQKSHLIKEKTFCSLIQHAGQFLLTLVNQVDCLRTLVVKNGFSAILSIVCLEDLEFVIRKGIFLMFKQSLTTADSRLRKTIMNNSDLTLTKLAEFSIFCGDYETQESVTEILMRFSLTSKQKLNKIMSWYKKYPQVVSLIELLDYKNFDTSCREFLNKLNDCAIFGQKVITLICIEAFANDIKLKKPTAEKYKELWVDFSVSTGSIHLVCDRGGNAWLILYVEPKHVRTIFCSNRKNNDGENIKQILVELSTPLEVQLHSSEVFIVTLTLVFLDEPKFYTVETCFFQKCYPKAYQAEKQGRNKPGVNHIRCNGQRQLKLPFSASTPKAMAGSCTFSQRNVNQKAAKVVSGCSQVVPNLSDKKNKFDRKNSTPSSSIKSSAINHLRDSSAKADSKFRQMCEERLSLIRSQSSQASEVIPQSNTSRVLVKLAKEESHKTISVSTEQKQSLLSGKNPLPANSWRKTMDRYEDNFPEEHSEDSPFYLTSRRPLETDKTFNINGSLNGPAAGEGTKFTGMSNKCENKENIIDENSTNKSNLKILKNLLVSEGFNGQAENFKGSGKLSSSNLSLSRKINTSESANLASSNPSKSIFTFKKKENSSDQQKIANLTLEARSILDPKRSSSEATQSAIKNTPNDKLINCGSSVESSVTVNTGAKSGDLLSEYKSRKPKLLWSPKLLPKVNEPNIRGENLQEISGETNYTSSEMSQLFNKAKKVYSSNECTTVDTPFEKNNPNSTIETRETDKQTIRDGSKIEVTTSSGKQQSLPPANEIKNTGKPTKKDSFQNKQSSEAQSLQNQPPSSYSKKSINKTSSIGDKKMTSPDFSWHCKIPFRTYHTKNPPKTAANQSTPEKIFENLRDQTFKENVIKKSQTQTVSKKRKLFNPNYYLEDISSMSEKHDPHSSPSPAKKRRKSIKIDLQNKQDELNKKQKNCEPMIFEDVYEFDVLNYSSRLQQKPAKRPRRSSRLLSKVNYVEPSSDDDLICSKNSIKLGEQKKESMQTKKLPRDDIQQNCSKTISSTELIDSFQESKKTLVEENLLPNKQNKKNIANPEQNVMKGKKLKQSRKKSKFEIIKDMDTSDSTKPISTLGSLTFNKSKNSSNTEKSGLKTLKKIDFTESIQQSSQENQELLNKKQNNDCNSLNKNNTTESTLMLARTSPVNSVSHSLIEETLTKDESQKTGFISLIEKPSCDMLREEKQSEMRLEEAPIEDRRSDVSSLELNEPPFRLSTDEIAPDIADQRESSPKLNSTGTQAEARAELSFLDSLITNLERMSLSGGRKKILKEVGSLESSLKKMEMFTESNNKQLNKKCLQAKKNLENMVTHCEEFLQTFETMMADIKSTMTRLSKDVENDQDTKLKIVEDIEKMCKERRSTVRFDKFF